MDDGDGPARLLGDAAIVRHRGKSEAAIDNPRATLRVQDAEGSLAAMVWRFEPSADERPKRVSRAAMPSTSPASDALAKELMRRGFRFVALSSLRRRFDVGTLRA